MSAARAAQEAVIRAGKQRNEAAVRRREVFTHEHVVLGRSYQELADEVGISKARVIQIVKGSDR